MTRFTNVASLTLLAAASADAGVWSFQDDEFNGGDWTNSTYIVDGDATAIVLHHPDGDLEANGYLGMEFTSNGAAIATGLSLSEHARYDPSVEGAISEIAYGFLSRSRMNFETFFVPGHFMLVQDGIVYQYYQNGYADESGDWVALSASGLSADDFYAYDPATNGSDHDAHPDFSGNGSEIQFGLLHGLYNFNGTTQWSVRDYDELNIRVVGVPAPGSAALLAVGGVAATRRRR